MFRRRAFGATPQHVYRAIARVLIRRLPPNLHRVNQARLPRVSTDPQPSADHHRRRAWPRQPSRSDSYRHVRPQRALQPPCVRVAENDRPSFRRRHRVHGTRPGLRLNATVRPVGITPLCQPTKKEAPNCLCLTLFSRSACTSLVSRPRSRCPQDPNRWFVARFP